MALAIVIGTIIAIMRLSPSRILNAFATVYIWFFRGAPALIQLIFWFNLSLVVREFSLSLPFVGTIFSVKTNDVMTPFVIGGRRAVALRGWLHGRDHPRRHQVRTAGQTEAAASLGMTLPADPAADHHAAGHALHPAPDRQRDDQPSEDDLAGHHHRRRRPALCSAEHLRAHLRNHSAADRGRLLVPVRRDDPFHRPALHRAVLRPQRTARGSGRSTRIMQRALGFRREARPA